MLGNVWEWCEDTWHNNYERAPSDGEALLDKQGENRVTRGGSWNSNARNCRCAYRYGWHPDTRNHNVGFRLVLAPRSKDKDEV